MGSMLKRQFFVAEDPSQKFLDLPVFHIVKGDLSRRL